MNTQQTADNQKLFEEKQAAAEVELKKEFGPTYNKRLDQAKKLADNLGIPLNESVLNESSSMALSVYSPDNLASLLEDKVEQDNSDIIAQFKRGELNQAIH